MSETEKETEAQIEANIETKKETRKEEDKSGRLASDGGLYKNLNISVKQLSIAIVVLCITLLAMMVFGSQKSGYTITFDSKGGSDVSEEICEYGQTLKLPVPPERQGYVFEGWSLDENGQDPLEEPYIVENSATLYAMWKPEGDRPQNP